MEPSASGSTQDGKIRLPGADGIRILPGHDADDLADVSQIVRHPRRQMLSQRHDSEFGMPAALRQVSVGQTELPKTGQAASPERVKGAEQLAKRTAAGFREHRLAIERRKWHRVAMLEQVLDARHPVGTLAMNQVADDVERTPGARAFGSIGPVRRQILQLRAKNRRSSTKDRQRRLEPEIHHASARRCAASARVRSAAGISLQPLTFCPAHNGENCPLPWLSALARSGATAEAANGKAGAISLMGPISRTSLLTMPRAGRPVNTLVTAVVRASAVFNAAR